MESLAAQYLSLREKNKLNLEELKYPIGRFHFEVPTQEQLDEWIDTIETLPEEIKKLVNSLSYEDLESQYRPDGWNIKQVVHHLADSHMNSFIRFKLTLTEDNPTLRPYNEGEWAKTDDASSEDIADSLELLTGLHKRWVTLLKSLQPEEMNRTFVHPEYSNQYNLKWLLCLYNWHCKHHLAHIKLAIDNR